MKRIFAWIGFVLVTSGITLLGIQVGRDWTGGFHDGVEPVVSTIEKVPWVFWDEGLWRREYQFKDVSKPTLILYRLSPALFSFRFENSERPKTIEEWSKTSQKNILIANGVYFNEKNQPAGLLITNGKRVGNGMFDAAKSGMITLSPVLAIVDTAGVRFNIKSYKEAAQSYPFLIKAGKDALSNDTKLYARRTFVGMDKAGYFYVGIVPGPAVSLYELMDRLDELDVSWDNVINLDGGPSSGLVASFGSNKEMIDSFVPVPNIILIEPRH